MIRSLTIQISSTSGVGPQGELEVVFSRWDQFDTPETQRPEFQYAVRMGSETLAYGHDLRLASGDGINHVKAMATLIRFLASDGEKYRAQLGRTTNTSAEAVQHRTGDSYLFNEQTAEWAYELAEELEDAGYELDDDRERERLSEALDVIALQMSGESWNADTVEKIAAIVRLTGRSIEDVPETTPARECACEIGTRQRAQYGNVHSEDERR
jgi:hypothetical protein